MAKVYAKFVGSPQQELNVNTVADVKVAMSASNSTVTVNGEVRPDDFPLAEGMFIVLSQQVKGNADLLRIVAKTADKQVVVTSLGKHKKYTINGVLISAKQLEKLCFAVLSDLGFD